MTCTRTNRKDRGRRQQRVDNRTRRDRILRRTLAFAEQMPAMTDAHLAWSLEKSEAGFRGFFDRLSADTYLERDPTCGQWSVNVIDVFCAWSVQFQLLTDVTAWHRR